MRRALTLAVAGLLSAWLLPSTSSAAIPAMCGKPTYVHAFHVETEWSKKVYKRSESAKVEVTVTRPAHEDPGDNGIPIDPPVSTAEAGVTVTTAPMTNVFPPPFGRGITDADGKVYFKIPLKDLKPGRYDARTYGEKWTNEGGCPDIVEWGDKYEPKIITVK